MKKTFISRGACAYPQYKNFIVSYKTIKRLSSGQPFYIHHSSMSAAPTSITYRRMFTSAMRFKDGYEVL
ncbi:MULTISPECIES: hypothetical protein [Metabacillus]|jgi:hypothetical protein|uniref:Uncharacterized protein n=1 Tax=Metabacillus rhizolycopersici TaxID=2875709 RepID=A0ABS7USV7_9BACI|nr:MULTISPECIES: hypothetical protein [Metabacillus]MBZ5751381.1 hypothetical protein [Metabacillus rhizolycopersici]MCM3651131.1 hypothetical protein [Metabacillus litoralis]